MKWYGSLTSFNLNTVAYKKKKNFQKLKFSKRHTSYYANSTHPTVTFFFPAFWKFLLFKKPIRLHTSWSSAALLLFLYNPVYYFIFPLPSYIPTFTLDNQVGALSMPFFYRNRFFGLFWNLLKKTFFQFTKIFFRKIKFKGKGYYAYKNYKNTFALQFGYSHIIRLYFFFIRAKFLAKTSILIFGLNARNINAAACKFFFVKPINIFTNRGIRFSRQIVYKKTGKISSYR